MPGRIRAPRGGPEEAKRDRLADHHEQLLRRQLRLRALFHTERRDAQREHRRLEPGQRGHRAFDPDVIGVRGAAANAQTAAVPDQAVVGRAARDGEIQIFPGQHARGRRALLIQPAIERVEQPRAQQLRLQHAAVA